MISKFINFFIPRQRQENAEEHRQYKLVTYFVIVTFLFDLNYISLSSTIGFEMGMRIMAITAGAHLLQAFAIRLDWPLWLVSNLYVLFGVFGVVGCTYYSGGFYSPVIVWLASSPIVALLMAGKRSGFVWMFINAAMVVVFALMAKNGYEFPVDYDAEWSNFFIANTFFGLVIIIFVVALVFENGKNTALRKLAQKNILLAEEKKKTALYALSQEIHDNVGQTLFLAKLNLSTFDLVPDDERERVKNSMELLSQAIDKLRDISSTLNEENITNFSLLNSLKVDMETISGIGALKTKLEVQGEVQKLNSKTEFVLYRIAQEVINNVIKHSQAAHLHVKLIFTSNLLTMYFKDDGVGMNSEQLLKDGQGMRNMRERTASIQGEINFSSSENRGVEVTVKAPFYS